MTLNHDQLYEIEALLRRGVQHPATVELVLQARSAIVLQEQLAAARRETVELEQTIARWLRSCAVGNFYQGSKRAEQLTCAAIANAIERGEHRYG